MFYLIPPAGIPIRFRDILQTIVYSIGSNPEREDFRKSLLSLAGVNHCLFFNSGRTALVHILKALKNLSGPGKDEVIIPAYTCFSVPSAIVRAGMKIRLVDIDSKTMDYRYDKLEKADFENVLAVLSCNLFGIISDWKKLGPIAREKGVYAVEDAAQTLGVRLDGKASGGFGDVAFFSFGRGKNLSTYSGGVVLTGNESIAAELQPIFRGRKGNLFREIDAAAKITLYGLFLRPRLYWIPNAIPFLKLGETVFDPEFKLDFLTGIQYNAGTVLFRKLEEINSIRINNAKKLSNALLDLKGFCIPGYYENDPIPYVRLPVIVNTRSERDKIIENLRKANIMAGSMYPSTIRQIPGIARYLASAENDFTGSEEVANRLLCLPTHPYLSDRDISNIINVIKNAL
jgi:perosamine synthetase